MPVTASCACTKAACRTDVSDNGVAIYALVDLIASARLQIMIRTSLILTVFLSLLCPLQADAASMVKQIQAQKRANRAALLEEYKELKRESYKHYNKKLSRLIESCADDGLVKRGLELYAELKSNDPDFEDLEELAQELEEAEIEDDDRSLKRIEKKYRRAQERYADDLIPFTARLIQKEMYGLAYDNIQEIIYCDPDNKTIRKYMGHDFNRKTDTWMNHYADEMHDEHGLIWDRELGWVLHKERDEYKDGMHYDYTTEEWGKLEELNKKHSSLETAWPIITQHYEIYAACDLQVGIRAANELEGLYQAWIRNFVAFFGNLAMERLFDRTAAPRKLKVYIFSDQDDFMKYARQKKIFDPIVAQSVGFYSPRLTSSQFFLSDGWINTLWHEVTHQLFGEHSNQKGTARTALAEGLAVYMEYGRIDQRNKRIIINIDENQDIQRLRPLVEGNKLPGFYDIWNLKREEFHGVHRGRNYSLAGLCVFFLMQYEDGKYAMDFIDYVTESHQFPKEGAPLHDYLGISAGELEKQYKGWVKEQF